jgi:hypothetical protein
MNLRSKEPVVQIVPFRIVEQNEPDLPGTRVVFEVLLALTRVPDVVVPLVIDKALQAVALRETVDEALAVFAGAARQVVGSLRRKGCRLPGWS